MDSSERNESCHNYYHQSLEEYWPSQGSNQRPSLLNSCMLPIELWGSAHFQRLLTKSAICTVCPMQNILKKLSDFQRTMLPRNSICCKMEWIYQSIILSRLDWHVLMDTRDALTLYQLNLRPVQIQRTCRQQNSCN